MSEVPDHSSRLRVADLGEFGLIARIAKRLGAPPPPAGPGDDAAVVAAPDGRVVASTDLLAEGVHFRFDWSSAYDIGRKAAAANLADIAAMGAVPTALLVGIAVPGHTDVAVVDGLCDGLRDECRDVGTSVVGGDTISSADRLTLAVTALGDLQGRAPVTRAAATAGDLVLAGRLGWSAAGLALLSAGVRQERFAPLLSAHRRPQPPYELGPLLAEAGALALCDVSDGLVADLAHLTDACGGSADIDIELLVVDPLVQAAADLLDLSATTWVLTGGEDHALLAVLPHGHRVAGAVRIGSLWPHRAGGVRVPGWSSTAPQGHDHFGP